MEREKKSIGRREFKEELNQGVLIGAVGGGGGGGGEILEKEADNYHAMENYEPGGGGLISISKKVN